METQADTAAYHISVGTGNNAVKETLKVMRRVAREYRRNPQIIALAQSITRNVPEKNWRGQVEALHAYVRDAIRYTLDTNEVEVLQTPPHLLVTKQGDCDDKATLLATLLESIGHPARFVAVGFDGANLSHVLVDTRIGEQWTALETTEPVSAGWFPPAVNISYVVQV